MSEPTGEEYFLSICLTYSIFEIDFPKKGGTYG